MALTVYFPRMASRCLRGEAGTTTARIKKYRCDEGYREVRQFAGHTNTVLAVAFSPDGKQVLTGSRDNTARLWDAATGHELRVFLGHTGAIRSVAFSPDGKQVLTSSADGTVRVWDVATGENSARCSASAMAHGPLSMPQVVSMPMTLIKLMGFPGCSLMIPSGLCRQRFLCGTTMNRVCFLGS